MKKNLLLFITILSSLQFLAQTIALNPSTLESFTANVNSYSDSKSFTAQALLFSSAGNMQVEVFGSFQLSTDEETWSNVVTVPVNIGVPTPFGMKYGSIPVTIFVRFAPTTDGSSNGGITALYMGTNRGLNLSGVAGLNNSTIINNLNIKSFPNPTNHQLTIEGLNNEFYTFQILNNLGAVVKEGNLENKVLNVSELNIGLYHLVLKNENSKLTTSFIKN